MIDILVYFNERLFLIFQAFLYESMSDAIFFVDDIGMHFIVLFFELDHASASHFHQNISINIAQL